MKIIKYKMREQINRGTEKNPDVESRFYNVQMGWNEVNESIAKAEAYNGEYTVEEDGEPAPGPTVEERIAAVESALKKLLSVLGKLGYEEALK